jgi:hypothetical protein
MCSPGANEFHHQVFHSGQSSQDRGPVWSAGGLNGRIFVVVADHVVQFKDFIAVV